MQKYIQDASETMQSVIRPLPFCLQPFYGGKLHRVTAEVKNPTGEVTCRVNGEWNASMEFTFTNVSLVYILNSSQTWH